VSVAATGNQNRTKGA